MVVVVGGLVRLGVLGEGRGGHEAGVDFGDGGCGGGRAGDGGLLGLGLGRWGGVGEVRGGVGEVGWWLARLVDAACGAGGAVVGGRVWSGEGSAVEVDRGCGGARVGGWSGCRLRCRVWLLLLLLLLGRVGERGGVGVEMVGGWWKRALGVGEAVAVVDAGGGRRRGPAVAGLRVGEGMRGAGAGVPGHLRHLRQGSVDHGRAGHGRDRLLFVYGRLRVHALLGADVAEGGVVGGLIEARGGGVGSSVVTDKVEVLTLRRGDAEGLFHETVGLVAIAVRSFFAREFEVGVASSSTVGCFACPCCSQGWCESVAAAFAFHFSVGEETARDSTCAP